MAANVLVPSKTLPENEELKAFVYGQCLLESKISPRASPENAYRQFLRDAQGAPFCALDASGTKEKDLKGPFLAITNSVVKEVMPTIFEGLGSTVKTLLAPEMVRSQQPLQDPGVPELNRLFTLTKPKQPEDPTIVEAFFLSTPSWDSPIFEACYLKIESRKQPQGHFGRWTGQEVKFHVSGKCSFSRFSVNTSMIAKFMKGKEDAESKTSSYLSRCTEYAEIASHQKRLPASDQASPISEETK